MTVRGVKAGQKTEMLPRPRKDEIAVENFMACAERPLQAYHNITIEAPYAEVKGDPRGNSLNASGCRQDGLNIWLKNDLSHGMGRFSSIRGQICVVHTTGNLAKPK